MLSVRSASFNLWAHSFARNELDTRTYNEAGKSHKSLKTRYDDRSSRKAKDRSEKAAKRGQHLAKRSRRAIRAARPIRSTGKRKDKQKRLALSATRVNNAHGKTCHRLFGETPLRRPSGNVSPRCRLLREERRGGRRKRKAKRRSRRPTAFRSDRRNREEKRITVPTPTETPFAADTDELCRPLEVAAAVVDCEGTVVATVVSSPVEEVVASSRLGINRSPTTPTCFLSLLPIALPLRTTSDGAVRLQEVGRSGQVTAATGTGGEVWTKAPLHRCEQTTQLWNRSAYARDDEQDE
uniref:Late endosomal/lysosomal adaptor and MAPK and MTOR activator 5 n=1 Tax=Trichuris muris TaxID=70415 RepID=A0A5S6QKL5_TRIMR